MNRKPESEIRAETPSLGGAVIFRAKAGLLQSRRLAQNVLVHRDKRHPRGESLKGGEVIAESVTRLWTDGPEAEKFLQAGKAHNLRIAVRRLDGVEVPAGAVFSFWRHVGRATRRRGYVRGRELREGCLVPSVGGGLCQLSNALYDAALKAGFEIVERHAHTRVIPGSLAEAGRDATVFWNYVDLRWRSDAPFRIEARLTPELLTVRFRGAGARKKEAAPRTRSLPVPVHAAHGPNSCASCGVLECFRNVEGRPETRSFGRSAVLVDEFWPEFDEYVRAHRGEGDLLAVPLDGKRFGRPNYAWETGGFGRVAERRLATALRALASRRLAQQGAARQRALLRHAENLAAGYAGLLAYDVTHVTVMQNLLPFLWREGHLGGRTFDVLMTGLPLADLHRRLDAAHAAHPESPTLADFRADEWMLAAEEEALAHARRVVTPHTEVAALFGARAVPLNWRMPAGRSVRRGAKLVFPASTLGRKGAYEVRAVAERLRLPVAVAGAPLEGADFWRGVQIEGRAGGDWLDGAGVVLLPAFVEHRPRRLLEAVACGVPVVASGACGLANVEGVVSVATGDVEALCAAVERALGGGA